MKGFPVIELTLYKGSWSAETADLTVIMINGVKKINFLSMCSYAI